MKSKLNLTIDKDLIPLSKAFARKRGKSVSELVEYLLRDHIQREAPSFAKKWRGRFHAAEQDATRYETLKKRYEL